MNRPTTSTAIPTRALKFEALANISASFELFCLASGMEALGEMMDHDARAICGPRHARGHDRRAISIRRLLQAVYNNNPRFHIPDLSVFGMIRNKWGLENYGNSLLTSLRAHRLGEEMKRDTGSS